MPPGRRGPKTLLFLDLARSQPYGATTLQERGVGGRIGCILRVAEGLAIDHRVVVVQRDAPGTPDGQASYIGVRDIESVSQPDAVVFVRGDFVGGDRTFEGIRAAFPDAHMFLWLHNFVPSVALDRPIRFWHFEHKRAFRNRMSAVDRANVSILGVSQTHAASIRQALHDYYSRKHSIDVRYIYNPIEDDLVADGTSYDSDQLIYLSAPDRGLDRAIALTERAREECPTLRLCVAIPEYSTLPGRLPEHAVFLGSLPRPDLFPHIRRSLCVLSPNLNVPEAFGLVYAESNAVGTPVLAHAIGAAAEILGGASQLVDCRDERAVVKRILAWRAGDRPRVEGRVEFRLSAVRRQWMHLLEAPPGVGR